MLMFILLLFCLLCKNNLIIVKMFVFSLTPLLVLLSPFSELLSICSQTQNVEIKELW